MTKDQISKLARAIGRPPIFEKEEDMQKAILDYFDNHALIELPRDNAEQEPEYLFQPTISGLAFHLGMSTESLRRYGEKEAFCATVKRAKQIVEISLEHKLHTKHATGAIFNLKTNFDWGNAEQLEEAIAGFVIRSNANRD